MKNYVITNVAIETAHNIVCKYVRLVKCGESSELCENGSYFGATWRQVAQSGSMWKYFIQPHCAAF